MGISRRIFLQLTVGAAGGSITRLVRAQPADEPATRGQRKAKIVIVGGGFAGAACALSLRHLNPAFEVMLVDPDDRYITCPMSNAALVGLRNFHSITVSRRGLERAGVIYARDRVIAIDTQRRRARLGAGAVLAYDRLVMAPGIRFLWGTPQGYDEAASLAMPHAWVAGAQTQILAAQLREIRDGGVVAISVPTGPMRCPPAPFERASLIAGFLKANKPRAKVLIFDGNNHFPRQDAFTEAWHSLYPGMIEWIPMTEDGVVMRVAPTEMTLYTALGKQRVDVANVIPPQAPGLLAPQAGLASDHGWCPVKPLSFESQLIEDVHVIGDACIADPMPKSASAANAQARQCALAIVASLAGREPPAPRFESVCYSLLEPGSALSIHGRFDVAGGAIRQLQGEEARPATPREEVRSAENWYRHIVKVSFAATVTS
ncbi:MAG: FAD-dependent oxidoreductase [Gammaproteobacteria bacterium]